MCWHVTLSLSLPNSGTVAVLWLWTWTPRPQRSKPGWSTKVSPECEWRGDRLGALTRSRRGRGSCGMLASDFRYLLIRSTVSSLGVLTGNLLLGMTKDEIRTVCPEEGGKVFFQLQGIKSAIAVRSVTRDTHSPEIQLQNISNVCPVSYSSPVNHPACMAATDQPLLFSLSSPHMNNCNYCVWFVFVIIYLLLLNETCIS